MSAKKECDVADEGGDTNAAALSPKVPVPVTGTEQEYWLPNNRPDTVVNKDAKVLASGSGPTALLTIDAIVQMLRCTATLVAPSAVIVSVNSVLL